MDVGTYDNHTIVSMTAYKNVAPEDPHNVGK